MAQTLRDRKTGDVISQVFQLVFSCFGRLLAIQLVFWIPVGLVLGGVLLMAALGGGGPIAAISGIVALLALIVLQPIPGAAAMVALSDEFTGNRTPLSACFGRAFSRLGSLLLIGILVGILALVGVLTLGIMTVVWICTYYVATQVAVLEDRGASASLSRSSALTRGSRWEVFAVLIVMALVAWAIQMAFVMPITLLSLAGGSEPGPITNVIGSIVQNVVGSMLTAAAGVAVYFNLRVRGEGFDLEQLTSLVDEIGSRGDDEWTRPDDAQ